MPDTWVNPELSLGATAYDKRVKEFVRITNGKCTLDHSSPEGFHKAHEATNGCCHYTPCEAIAIRCTGVTKTGDPIVGFTYRAVDIADLVPAQPSSMPDLSRVRPSRRSGRL